MSDILELLDELDALEKFDKPQVWKDAAISSAYPALSAEIRRLREENERMRYALESISILKNKIDYDEFEVAIDIARRALEEADA